MLDLFQLALFATAVISSAVASVTGFGIGSLMTPLLNSQFELKLAVALVSVPHFVATTLRCYILRKEIDKQALLRFGIASAVGGLLGALAQNYCRDPILLKIFAGLLIFAGFLAATGLSRRFILPKVLSAPAGILSGVFGGMVGNQGGIRAAALLSMNLSKEAFVATSTATGVIVDLARMPVYIYTQTSELSNNWLILTSTVIASILGTYLGMNLLNRIPEKIFSRIVGITILMLGIYMARAPI